MKTVNNITNDPGLQQKYADLLELLRSLGKTAVAFSGGVDSTFLLAAAKNAPSEALIALTMKQPYFQQKELEEAERFTGEIGVTHKIIEEPVNPEVMENPTNRCYLCKSSTFKRFREEIESLGYDTLLDGTNADDTGEYRPGLRATREHQVRSPLQETGFTKKEIRNLAREMGLPIWDKPANTCLITRIPYNTHVRNDDLRQIEDAEFFLAQMGFREVRVRKHDDLAKIEVDPDLIQDLTEPKIRGDITAHFKTLGFRYITIDLEGYKTGSLDKALLEKSKQQS